jgi:hypothetical protein
MQVRVNVQYHPHGKINRQDMPRRGPPCFASEGSGFVEVGEVLCLFLQPKINYSLQLCNPGDIVLCATLKDS